MVSDFRYLVIGAGGIGGAIAVYLASNDRDVSVVARGAHLNAIREKGLFLQSARLGALRVSNVTAYAPGDDVGLHDIVFVCVKGYSFQETIPLIEKSSSEKTVIIPILNSLNAGGRIRAALPGRCVLDGCVYGSSYVSAPGEITQPMPLFRIVFGENGGHRIVFGENGGSHIVFGENGGPRAAPDILANICGDLSECGIDAVLSQNIERDVFRKFAVISAFAATDSYYNVSAGNLHKPGKERDLFLSLLGELQMIADAKGYIIYGGIKADAMMTMDSFTPGLTSSMHKDVAAGKDFEKQELIFDVVETAESMGLETPQYMKVALRFGYTPKK